MPKKTSKAAKVAGGASTPKSARRQDGGRKSGSAKPPKARKAQHGEGKADGFASLGGFAGPLLGDLIAKALLAGADALAGSSSPKAESANDARTSEGPNEPASAPLEGEVEPARPGAAGVGMVDLAGYAMAIAVSEIASRFVASYERQMGNGPVVRQTAKGAKAAAGMAWSAFDNKG